MTGRLDGIEEMLCGFFGPQLTAAAPDLVFAVNRILTQWGRTADGATALWDRMDSLLFNTIYNVSGKTMTLEGRGRIATEEIRWAADKLLSLAYAGRPQDDATKDALFDLSRSESFCAMRELVGRYPLEEDEKGFILRVLEENGELR